MPAHNVLSEISKAEASQGTSGSTSNPVDFVDGPLASVPVAGTAGYAPGCIYSVTNITGANTDDPIYVNAGTASSCVFVLIDNRIRAYAIIQAAAVCVDQFFFIADRAYEILSIQEIHSVADATSTTLTAQVKKATADLTLAGGGTAVQVGTFNLRATAATLLTGTISAGNRFLAVGDRLGLDIVNTGSAPVELQGAVVQVNMRPRSA